MVVVLSVATVTVMGASPLVMALVNVIFTSVTLVKVFDAWVILVPVPWPPSQTTASAAATRGLALPVSAVLRSPSARLLVSKVAALSLPVRFDVSTSCDSPLIVMMDAVTRELLSLLPLMAVASPDSDSVPSGFLPTALRSMLRAPVALPPNCIVRGVLLVGAFTLSRPPYEVWPAAANASTKKEYVPGWALGPAVPEP